MTSRQVIDNNPKTPTCKTLKNARVFPRSHTYRAPGSRVFHRFQLICTVTAVTVSESAHLLGLATKTRM